MGCDQEREIVAKALREMQNLQASLEAMGISVELRRLQLVEDGAKAEYRAAVRNLAECVRRDVNP